MAFTVLTEDPAAREVGDLIIVDDRAGYVDLLGLLEHNFVDKVEEEEDIQEDETDGRSDSGVGAGHEEEGGDGEEDGQEEDAESEYEDTESERS